MTDSFFTNRNEYDRQVATFGSATCEQLIESCVRRMASVDGVFETAKRVQRIADICAGAYVLPVDHWQKLGLPKSAEPLATPSRLKRTFRAINGSTGLPYLIGLITGYLLGAS